MNVLAKRNLTGLVLGVMVAWATPALSDVSVNFDGTGAPCAFGAGPLTNQYSGLGLAFSGLDGNGGSILNQCGNFGFNAHSGTDFFAFNSGSPSFTGTSEAVDFSFLASSVSIWAATTNGGTVTIRAFDSSLSLLASQTLVVSTDWTQLSVSAANISRIELFMSRGIGAYDDLYITTAAAPVPEPETYAMMLAGLGVLGFMGRRRKQQVAA